MKHLLTARIFVGSMVVVSFLISFCSCSANNTVKEFTSFSMGSALTAKIYSQDEQLATQVQTAVTNALADVENALSNTKEDAEIYTLNKNGEIYASQYLKDVLMESILLCNTLNRSVDLSLGKVTSLWGFNTQTPSLPEKEEIETNLNEVNIEKILIDDASTKIVIDKSISIDLGAFGKGAACDAVFEEIRLTGVPFLMSLGGTVFAFSDGPDDGKWTIGIRNPLSDANSYFATLSLNSLYPKNALFISTSGSYEKNFIQNGKIYHHIINPKTGYPVDTNLVAVTVVAHSGLSADVLSTACFIDGLTKNTLSYLDSFSAEAVFVFDDGTYYATEGLKESLTITNSDFSEREYNEN